VGSTITITVLGLGLALISNIGIKASRFSMSSVLSYKVVKKRFIGARPPHSIPLPRVQGRGEGEGEISFASPVLAVCRKIPLGHISTLKGSWGRLVGGGVYKRSIGIIGWGRIRKAVAERAKGFSKEILAHGVKKDEIFSQLFIS
jgi:hypothetical protein